MKKRMTELEAQIALQSENMDKLSINSNQKEEKLNNDITEYINQINDLKNEMEVLNNIITNLTEGADLESGFNEPDEFVDILQALKKNKKSFLLLIVREDGVNFEEKVTLESLSIVESNEGITASCPFKQYVDVWTKVKKKKSSSKNKTSKTPKKKSYKVKKGDTLKKISKKMYGTQNYASKIYKWNKTEIEKAAKKNGRKSSESGKYIYKGTKLKLKTIK